MTITEYLQNFEKVNSPSVRNPESSARSENARFEENQIIEEYEGNCEKCEKVTRKKSCSVCE